MNVIVHEIPGPRFVKFDQEADGMRFPALSSGVKEATKAGCSVYVTREVKAEQIAAFRAEPQPFECAGYVVTSNGAAEKEAMADAATAARGAGTVEEAVKEYTGKMPLPDGLTADAVRETTMGYLSRQGT